jgi:hypothetical protein
MESKIIRNKYVKDGTVELFEFQDDFGVIVSYSVVRAYLGKNVIGGAAKTEEVKFLNEEEAINFFNNQ